jgi:hypothetical protein
MLALVVRISAVGGPGSRRQFPVRIGDFLAD